MLKDDPAAPSVSLIVITRAGGDQRPSFGEALLDGARAAGYSGGRTRRIPGAIGIALDLVTTFALLAFGQALGAANIAGFLAGGLVALAAGGLKGPRASGAHQLRRPSAAQVGRHVVVAVLALGLRGGAIATALAYGLPGWLAVLLGLGVGWVAVAAGGAFYTPSLPQPHPPAALRWSVAAVGIAGSVFLLRVLYLKVFPLTPEEAYYWNYSIRPDFGYLDHPPMVAWLIALAEALFGHGEASIRIVSLVCGLGVVGFVYRLAGRLVDRPAALTAAALAAAIPYSFFAAGLMTTPDAPLAVAWAASLYLPPPGADRGRKPGVVRRRREPRARAAVQVHDRDAGPGGVGVLHPGSAGAHLAPSTGTLRRRPDRARSVRPRRVLELHQCVGFVQVPGRRTLRRHGIQPARPAEERGSHGSPAAYGCRTCRALALCSC